MYTAAKKKDESSMTVNKNNINETKSEVSTLSSKKVATPQVLSLQELKKKQRQNDKAYKKIPSKQKKHR